MQLYSVIMISRTIVTVNTNLFQLEEANSDLCLQYLCESSAIYKQFGSDALCTQTELTQC